MGQSSKAPHTSDTTVISWLLQVYVMSISIKACVRIHSRWRATQWTSQCSRPCSARRRCRGSFMKYGYGLIRQCTIQLQKNDLCYLP